MWIPTSFSFVLGFLGSLAPPSPLWGPQGKASLTARPQSCPGALQWYLHTPLWWHALWLLALSSMPKLSLHLHHRWRLSYSHRENASPSLPGLKVGSYTPLTFTSPFCSLQSRNPSVSQELAKGREWPTGTGLTLGQGTKGWRGEGPNAVS